MDFMQIPPADNAKNAYFQPMPHQIKLFVLQSLIVGKGQWHLKAQINVSSANDSNYRILITLLAPRNALLENIPIF